MIAVALAALSGLMWGAGDFAGGKATQRTPALVTAVLSKAASLPMLGLYLVLMPAAFHSAGVGWGMAAGLFGMSALVVFYRALSTGSMAIVAPISAVTAAVVPLVVGLVIEEPPGPVALAIGASHEVLEGGQVHRCCSVGAAPARSRRSPAVPFGP